MSQDNCWEFCYPRQSNKFLGRGVATAHVQLEHDAGEDERSAVHPRGNPTVDGDLFVEGGDVRVVMTALGPHLLVNRKIFSQSRGFDVEKSTQQDQHYYAPKADYCTECRTFRSTARNRHFQL